MSELSGQTRDSIPSSDSLTSRNRYQPDSSKPTETGSGHALRDEITGTPRDTYLLAFQTASPLKKAELTAVSSSNKKDSADKPQETPKRKNNETDDTFGIALNYARGFSDWLSDNFAKLSPRQDGFIYKTDVAKQIMDPVSGNGKDAANLATLYQVFERLACNFDNQPQLKDAVGKRVVDPQAASGQYIGSLAPLPQGLSDRLNLRLSKAGIDSFRNFMHDPQLKKNNAQNLAMVELGSLIPFFDSNGNGTFNRQEIEAALTSKEVTPKQKEGLQNLMDRMDRDNLHEHNACIRLADILPAQALTACLVGFGAERSIKRLETYKLNEAGIAQGSIPDCFFLASVIHLQNCDSKKLDKLNTAGKTGTYLDRIMTKNEKDGTYTVSFPGDLGNPITIPAPTQALISGWAYGYRDRITVLEQAMGKYESDRYEKPVKELVQQEGIDVNSPIYSERSRRFSGTKSSYNDKRRYKETLNLLTGAKIHSQLVGTLSEEKLRDFFKEKSKDLLLWAGAGEAPSSAETTNNIITGHAYAISYDQNAGRILLENPYKPDPGCRSVFVHHFGYIEPAGMEPANIDGQPKDGCNDGKFPIAMDEFRSHFTVIYWAALPADLNDSRMPALNAK